MFKKCTWYDKNLKWDVFSSGSFRPNSAIETTTFGKTHPALLGSTNDFNSIFSVSCFDNDKIYNYKINKDPDTGKFFIFQDQTFNTIKELIQFYESASIKNDEICLKKGVTCDLSYNIRPRDAWKISPEDLKMQYLDDGVTPRILGSGAFGRVYAGYWKDTIEVAIKELKMDQTDEFTKESEAMKKLNHERLLMLYG